MLKQVLQFLICVAAGTLILFLGHIFEEKEIGRGAVYNMIGILVIVPIPILTNWLLFPHPTPVPPPWGYKWPKLWTFAGVQYSPPGFKWPFLWHAAFVAIALFTAWALGWWWWPAKWTFGLGKWL